MSNIILTGKKTVGLFSLMSDLLFSVDTHRLGRAGSPAGRAVTRPAGTPALVLFLFFFILLHHLLFLHVLLVGRQGERTNPEEDPQGLQLYQGPRQRQLRQGATTQRRRLRGMFVCLLFFIIETVFFRSFNSLFQIIIIRKYQAQNRCELCCV